jgi:L-2-hydroxyglutarate oxidase LhgO
MTSDFDSIVIGAGVVGLAIANQLSYSGRKVLVIEEMSKAGQGISSRNSEVIHAGIYYPYDSLKRQLCIVGRKLLIEYCKNHNIDHKITGKLIVATNSDQSESLSSIMLNGIKNGVSDLQMLAKDQIQALEPDLNAISAIYSPSSGIFDSHAFILSLLASIEENNGLIVYNTKVSKITKLKDGFSIEIHGDDSFHISTKELINSAGLSAQHLSKKINKNDHTSVPPSFYCKGTYLSLACKSPFSHLIYPMPNRGGLGIHLTLDLGGRARFGPDTEWVLRPDYQIDNKKIDEFYTAIQQYYPAILKSSLEPDYVGIRPKVVSKNESPADFIIQDKSTHGMNNYIALYGIESPGLTASLAIGEYVEAKLN